MPKKNPKPLTERDREDARDVAFIKRTIRAIRSGRQKTYSLSSVLKEFGYDDLLARTSTKRRSA